MQTLVLRIPDELAEELEAEAKRLNLTKSEIARRRLSASSAPAEPASGFDLIADLVGSVDQGPADMSTRKKDYLKSTGYGKAKRGR
jgi:predicted DNA-binding protein